MEQRVARRLLGCALGSAILLFGGCGGGGSTTTSAAEFIHDLCTSIAEWAGRVEEESADLSKAVDPGASPAEGKELMLGFAKALIEHTGTLIDDVEAAGVPDVSGGKEGVSRFIQGLNGLRAAFQGLRVDIEALPTDDPAAFAEQAQEISTSIDRELNAIGEDFGRVQSPELDAAARDEPACRDLGFAR
jgi:hypothetical protein